MGTQPGAVVVANAVAVGVHKIAAAVGAVVVADAVAVNIRKADAADRVMGGLAQAPAVMAAARTPVAHRDAASAAAVSPFQSGFISCSSCRVLEAAKGLTENTTDANGSIQL